MFVEKLEIEKNFQINWKNSENCIDTWRKRDYNV